MNNSSSNRIKIPLENLKISTELMRFCEENEFENLSEMILIGTRKLETFDDFNKRMLFEYLQLLEYHGLEEFMDM